MDHSSLLSSLDAPSLRRATVLWFALTAMGLTWAFATPPLGAPDEPAHVVRAVAVAQGEWLGRVERIEAQSPDELSSTEVWFEVPRAYAEMGGVPSCYAFDPDQSAACAPPVGEATDEVEAASRAGTYPPPYYLAVGWPSLVLSPFRSLHAMRALSVVLATAFLTVGLEALLRTDRRGLALLGGLLGLTPMLLFLAGSVNPNGLEAAATFAVFATSAAALVGSGAVDRATVFGLAVAVVALSWSRPLSILMLAIAVSAVWLAYGRWARVLELWRSVVARRMLLTAGMLAILAAAFTLITRAYDAFAGYPRPEASLAEAARGAVERVPGHLEEMVGVFGWRDTRMVLAVPLIWLGLVVVGVVLALWVGSWRERIALGGLVVAVLAMPVASETSSYADYGYIWQGRYSLPLALGVPLLTGIVLARSRPVPRSWRVGAAVAVGAVFLGVHTFGWLTSLRRYGLGEDHPVLAVLESTAWSPPVPAAVLALGFVVAATAVTALSIAPALVGRSVQEPTQALPEAAA